MHRPIASLAGLLMDTPAKPKSGLEEIGISKTESARRPQLHPPFLSECAFVNPHNRRLLLVQVSHKYNSP